MKNILLILMLLFLSHDLYSQKQIRDKASEAQEKRQVYMQWGDWRPKARRVLGVPTNPAYFTVWQWSPTNRRYRSGDDIRPLKADGEENQRNVLNWQLRENAEALKKETDEQKDLNLNEFAHITSATSNADPLYLIYYKKRLKNLLDINNYWLFIVEYFPELELPSSSQRKVIEDMHDEFQVLQEKLKVSHGSNMDRGKRFLNYHEIMLDLRRLERKIGSYKHNQVRLKETRNNINTKIRQNQTIPEGMNDRERFNRIISNNPDFY